MEESPLYRVFVRDYNRLCALAARILQDPGLARDVVQESWMRLQKIRTLETGDPEKLRHLVMLTVRHTAYNLMRRQVPVPVEDTVLTELQDPAPLLPEQIEKRERLRILLAAMAELEETDRTILQLQYGQELTGRQIAAILGMKPAAVRQRAQRARKALKTKLEKKGLMCYDDL